MIYESRPGERSTSTCKGPWGPGNATVSRTNKKKCGPGTAHDLLRGPMRFPGEEEADLSPLAKAKPRAISGALFLQLRPRNCAIRRRVKSRPRATKYVENIVPDCTTRLMGADSRRIIHQNFFRAACFSVEKIAASSQEAPFLWIHAHPKV
jgi:hypothetical protein